MNLWVRAGLTLLAAASGGTLFRALKVPAGTMLGAMVAVMAFNLITEKGWVPAKTTIVAQTLIGATLGLRFTRAALMELKTIWLPAIIVVLGCVVLNFAIGFLVSRMGGLDLRTALLASAPGGQSEMALLAESMGADVTKVAVLQSLRLISVVSLMPLLFRILFRPDTT